MSVLAPEQLGAPEQLTGAEEAAFLELVASMEAAVPAETKEQVTREYASKDPSGTDFQCLG
jgi:hypothetical protein